MGINSKKLVKIYPSTLVLIKSKNSDYYESKINFTNLTDDYILVKSYNNQINLYKAKPSTTFIKPKETTNILIRRNEKENILTQIEKFLFKFYIANKKINDNEEAKEVYKSKLFNTDSKQEEIVPIILTEEKNEIKDFIHEYNESNLQKTMYSSTKLFSIDQKEIVFQINRNNQNQNLETNFIQLGQTSINLSNLTSEYLNIRSKTKKKSYYVVDPTYCTLPPNLTKK